MIKKLLFAVILCSATSFAFAGGLLTNTNQSVHFLRNPSLDASRGIEAVYTNPAGLVFLSDGLHFSFTNQSAFQTRTITSTFAPFAANNAGNPTKVFEGVASAPLVPSFQFAYKKDRWVVSTGFAITGGGGKATFNKGLASFEAPISMIPVGLTAKGVSTKAYSVDAYMEGRQYIFGVQINGSYKINDALSAGLGMRLNIVNNGYKAHLNSIQISPVHPSLNPTGASMLANTFFTNAAASAQGAANSLTPLLTGYGSATIGSLVTAGVLTAAQATQLSTGLGQNVSTLTVSQVNGAYNTAAATYTATATATADKQLDCTQVGWGVTPIISLNYHVAGLNLAAKYEFNSALNVQNKTKVDDTGLFKDGVNTPHDIPALLSVGAEYAICDKWKVSTGYHHFFDSDAKMASGKEQFINGGVNEYLFGSEYSINKLFLVSAGGQITRTGVTDAYQTDMSFSLNSYSLGFGGAVNISPKLRLNIAYFFTNYSNWTKVSANYNNINKPVGDQPLDVAKNIPGTDVFARTNKVFGIGLDYKF